MDIETGVDPPEGALEEVGEDQEGSREVPALGPGENPREALPFHRERGPRHFEYTYQDIADLTGLAVSTVRRYAQQGRFDPTTLEGVVTFLREREPIPEFDITAEMEQLQAASSCGLSMIGRREDGRGVFGFDTPNSQSFRETRLKVEKSLLDCGYVRTTWSDGKGGVLTGWGLRAVVE